MPTACAMQDPQPVDTQHGSRVLEPQVSFIYCRVMDANESQLSSTELARVVLKLAVLVVHSSCLLLVPCRIHSQWIPNTVLVFWSLK